MTAVIEVSYRVPLPPRGIGSNSRGTWTKQRASKQHREECAAAYVEQRVPADAPWERVHIDVEMRVCRKRLEAPGIGGSMAANTYRAWSHSYGRYRPTDTGNVHDACKAAIDALQPERWRQGRSGLVLVAGAGVIVGDDAKHCELGAPRITEVAEFEDEGVFLTVRRLP